MFLPTMQCWFSYITYLKITQSHMAPGHQIKFSVRTLWTKLINWSLFSENWVQCIQEVEFMSRGEEADGLFSFPFLSSLSFLPLSLPPFLLSSRWIFPLLISSSPSTPPFPFLLGTKEKEERERKAWHCARAHIERQEIHVKEKAKCWYRMLLELLSSLLV